MIFAVDGALAQTSPAATETKLSLAVGLGISGFDSDFYTDRVYGETLWVDYSPNVIPHALQGLGVEMYARDLDWNRSQAEPSNLRFDVAGGGLIYSWHHYRLIRPYVKYEVGFGNMDAMGANLRRYNQTRTVTSYGGGVEFHAMSNVWLRGEYEYQSWPDFFYSPQGKPIASLNPMGVTIGAMYHFGKHRLR
jgi:opacity protein-like surface antigen